MYCDTKIQISSFQISKSYKTNTLSKTFSTWFRNMKLPSNLDMWLTLPTYLSYFLLNSPIICNELMRRSRRSPSALAIVRSAVTTETVRCHGLRDRKHEICPKKNVDENTISAYTEFYVSGRSIFFRSVMAGQQYLFFAFRHFIFHTSRA